MSELTKMAKMGSKFIKTIKKCPKSGLKWIKSVPKNRSKHEQVQFEQKDVEMYIKIVLKLITKSPFQRNKKGYKLMVKELSHEINQL